jgi:hypothetical protein
VIKISYALAYWKSLLASLFYLVATGFDYENNTFHYVCSMKDAMIQLYLNNLAAAAAVASEVCLLGALMCHDIGMVLGALGVSEDQVHVAFLEGKSLFLMLPRV